MKLFAEQKEIFLVTLYAILIANLIMASIALWIWVLR